MHYLPYWYYMLYFPYKACKESIAVRSNFGTGVQIETHRTVAQ